MILGMRKKGATALRSPSASATVSIPPSTSASAPPALRANRVQPAVLTWSHFPALTCSRRVSRRDRITCAAKSAASTRALLGLRQVLPQSSLLQGPRSGDSSSAFPFDIASVPIAPTAAAKAVRRVIVWLVMAIMLAPCASTRRISAASNRVCKDEADASRLVTRKC